MDLGLQGRTALVTGAASGIGLASARAFAAEGCSLLLWDVSEKITPIAKELADAFDVQVDSCVVDIVDLDAARSRFAEFTGTGRRVQHVVHCAAIGSGKFGFPFTNVRPADWARTLDVNILGMVNLADVVTPHLIENAQERNLECSFVFLASVAGQMGSQTDPPYSASKAANINFAQCMAKDLARHGIRVNTVCPGMVQTPLNRSVWQAWHDNTAENERLSYDQWATNKIRSIVPLGRWQSSDDIASMIVFLSSDRAMQVTGQTINVDGGFVMHC